MSKRLSTVFQSSDKQIEIEYGHARIFVSLILERRSRLTITVYPDKSVLAKAPIGLSIDEVIKKIKYRAAWISKHIEYFEQFHPILPARKYISGETHFYLGRQYRLRIKKSDRPQVKLVGRFFQMELPNPMDSEKAKKLLQNWYSIHANNYLKGKFAIQLGRFRQYGIEEPEIKFRRMKKRWGSCSSKNVILLNTELVKTPLYSIDYVLIHELCHLIHPKHTAEFYRLLSRMVPDWKKRKEILERYLC